MKRVFTILMALIFTSAAWAQQAESSAFTLQQCIQYALDNSIAAKNAELDQRIAKARVNETVGIGLPQISGTVSLVDNPTLARFYGTYVENPTGGISFFPTGLPNARNGDVLAQKNFFQLPSSGTATLAINQIIFNGSYLVGLKASSTYKELSIKTADQTDQEIILQVTKAYYGVLINKARKNLFDDNIARVDSLLRNTSALNENGFAESIDVDRVKVTLNNLRTERDKFLNLDNLGIQLLKFQMNYPQDKPMDVAGDIQDVVVDASQLDNYTDQIDYAQRPDYRVLEVNKRLQELNVKNQYAASIPSLSFFANLGYSTQSNNVSGLFKTNSKVVDGQYGEVVVGPDKWYPNTQFGINLNVPLFSGLQRNYKVQQEKLKLLQINNNFISLKNAINLEVTQALVNYDNAVKSLTSQKENQQLAANIARVTKVKYEQGVGSSLEVTDAENSLRTAQTNYYSALYDAMVAKVDLDKAYGRLLPAATTTNSK